MWSRLSGGSAAGRGGITAERLRALAERNRAGGVELAHPARREVRQGPEVADRPAGLRVIPVGGADNAAVFASVVSTAGVMRCMLRQCDIAPFTREIIRDNRLGVGDVTLAAALCSIRAGMMDAGERAGAVARQQVIAEILAPNWREDNCMDQEEARVELERILANPANFGRQQWFLDVIHQLPTTGPDDHVVQGVYNRNTLAWVGAPTLEDKLRLIRAVAVHPASRIHMRSPYIVVLLLVAFSTRGQLTAQKLQRIKDELRTVMPVLADMLDANEITTTFANFGECIDDTNAHIIFARWLRHVPRAAIRLRVLLSQAAGSGVTSLDMIAEALSAHVDFPWHMVARRYPDEWAAVQQGLRAVNGRIYAGYAGNLGAVRATLFRRITWVAKELLMAFGNNSLKNYRGGAEDPTMVETVKAWIKANVEAMGAGEGLSDEDQSDEERRSLREMVNLARAHPNVAYHLADLGGHAHATVHERLEEGKMHGRGQ